MPPEEAAIFRSPPTEEVADRLASRLRGRARALSDDDLRALVEDTVYHERRRFEDAPPAHAEERLVDAMARAALDGRREILLASAERAVREYADEIHNRFSPRAWRIATRVLPGALVRLVTASSPGRLLSSDFDASSRIRLHGEVEAALALARRGTLVVAPTHISNLDSPLLGYAFYQAGLPPLAYGAGLNLFSNRTMAFWMRRLGAYTVDRRKRGRLYKDTLKDYAVELLRRGCHTLFFPGGTRSRSGRVERRLKKGLLGTGLVAWQEALAGGGGGEVFVVPCTLSSHLVLEAETLIADALAREGRSRYIIDDDESYQPATVASFLGRVLNLDEAVHVTLGGPLDLLGNPVDTRGRSLDSRGRPFDRTRYVTGAGGAVLHDPQRDRVYTDRLGRALVEAWHRDNVALSTHVAARAAWRLFARAHPGLDIYRLVRIDPARRRLPRSALLAGIEGLCAELSTLRDAGRLRTALPARPEDLLDDALRRFASWHRRRALETAGQELRLDPELLLFYSNRLDGYGLER